MKQVAAIVTKTIRHEAAINPVHHWQINNDSLINCEKGRFSAEVWFEREIQMLQGWMCYYCSVGHTPEIAA